MPITFPKINCYVLSTLIILVFTSSTVITFYHLLIKSVFYQVMLTCTCDLLETSSHISRYIDGLGRDRRNSIANALELYVFLGLSNRYALSSLCFVVVNSFRPSDAIWRHRSGSTLAQVMACCLMAPSHYLNQCWVIISKVYWHSSEGNTLATIN